MQNQFENLKVWQAAMQLIKEIYQITRSFPKEEQYGLISQLRRAAVSIPTNIAEGKGRNHKKEYIQFLYIARGSAYEVMTLLKVSEILGYLESRRAFNLLDLAAKVTAMLNALIQALQ